MSDKHVNEITGVRNDVSIKQAKQAEQTQKLARREARQVGSRQDIKEAAELMFFNPMAIRKKFKPLREKSSPQESSKSEKSSESKKPESAESAKAKEVAARYQQRNPELQQRTLLNLFKEMDPNASHDDLLKKLQKTYSDQSLVDEAIDYLIEVSENKEELKSKFIKIKEDFNAQYGREIQAGRNIGAQARAFSEKGLGSPTALRDLYREVTGNPRTPHKLFEELCSKFKFSDMKSIIDFILHSLGTDLKAKGPSISKEELQRLFGEARTMQAILGVFRFFFTRMKLIKGQFDRYDLTLPSRINFDVLARLLMKLLEERYPSPDKVLKLSFALGIAEELAAQVVIYTQYRDAMRHISPMLFKSERHRQEMLMAIMEALSDLEDELSHED